MFGMDTMTFNKIAGALLGSALLVMGLGIVADSVFYAKTPKQTAINIELPETEGAGETAAAKEPEVSLASLLASADVAKGEKSFKACKACHTIESGGKPPSFWLRLMEPRVTVMRMPRRAASST